MSDKILFVDDDPHILEAHQRNFRKRFPLQTALGGPAGLKLIAEQGPFAVVVADMQMPEMNGVEFLMAVKNRTPDTIRVMLTGNADQRTAIDAVNQGHIFRFLNKPCLPETLATTLESAIGQHRFLKAERDLLENTLNGSIKVLVDILGTIYPDMFKESELLRSYVAAYAKACGMSSAWELELAAMLSLIGHVTLPPEVVKSNQEGSSLSPAEMQLLIRVPEMGARLVRNIPRLERVAEIILYQRKRFNGSGFPDDSVKGDEIPIGARILAVLRDIAVLQKEGLDQFAICARLEARAGWYDPSVLESVFARFEVFSTIETDFPKKKKLVAFKELRVGDFLASNMETAEGILVAPSGTKISPMILEKMRNFAELQGVKEPLEIRLME